ncbi:MAG TPA: septal ring lytic transglycosylase RlpA family protein [Saprospiraceae bacterium]|nr:septal ring lytic transglycosylase RlpA family protein [Saprospiraceae bacterium]HMP12794.1 septal ring lytic transglycosylase RlpA family protein [Saprospiraceae bacterium]
MKKPMHLLWLLLLSCTALTAAAQQIEYGEATYYSDSFQGRETAYGVKYDKNELTTAHKMYPFGTLLRVTRLDNKKSVIVKVIDRGPYTDGRVVDLSRKAAEKLDMIKDGVVKVKVELHEQAPKTSTGTKPPTTATTTSTTADNAKPTRQPESYETGGNVAPTRTVNNNRTTAPTTTKPADSKPPEKEKTTQTAAKPAASAQLVGKDYTQYGLYKIQLVRPERKGFGVQVAALTTYENMMQQIADLQAKSFTNILVSIEKNKDNKPMYKIILGPFDKEEQATSYRSSLQKKYKMKGFVVNLGTINY